MLYANLLLNVLYHIQIRMKIRESCLQTGIFIYKQGFWVTKQDFYLQNETLGLQTGISACYLPEIKTTGTDIDKCMPPASRFGGDRAVKKQEVIDRLKSFFQKYYGVSGSFGEDEVKTTKYTDDIYDNPLYKVAYTAKGYGEKEE